MLWIICGFFGLVILAQATRILAAGCWLSRDHETSTADLDNLVLVIPVMNEQAVILESVDWFKQLSERLPGLTVVYVTTSRETRISGCDTTQEILEKAVSDHPRIKLVNEPGHKGVMATQLNYAIARLDNNEKTIVGIFNVDCRPTEESLHAAVNRLEQTPRSVVQQYSHYPYETPVGLHGAVLSHIALWQSRWSLQFELGRNLVANLVHGVVGPRLRTFLLPFNYVIGHGLFFGWSTWNELSGFPEDEINEDAFFGLQLRLSGYQVTTIPYLKKSDSAERIDIFTRQQCTWFNGPARAWCYLEKLYFGSDALPHKNRPPAKGFVVPVCETFKLFLHAVYWLLGPPLLVVVIPYVLLVEGAFPQFTVWMLLLILFCWGLNYLSYRVLDRLGLESNSPGGIPSAILAYLLHGVGPMRWIARTIAGQNSLENKYKTEKGVT